MALDLSFRRPHSLLPKEVFSLGQEDNNNNIPVDPINLSVPRTTKGNQEEESNPHQIQLDIAALNLICLARLQETAAVLTGHRPPPAHGNGSSFPLVNSNNNNRRNHKCDEPGCDKVISKLLYSFKVLIDPLKV